MEIFKNFDTVTHALFRIGDLGVVVVYMTFEFVYWWNGCYMSIFRHKRTLKIQWFKKVGLKQRMILCRRVMFPLLIHVSETKQPTTEWAILLPVYTDMPSVHQSPYDVHFQVCMYEWRWFWNGAKTTDIIFYLKLFTKISMYVWTRP